MNSTPPIRRVKLKRVEHLRPGDRIQPGAGLFTREGQKITSAMAMTDTWTRAVWAVCGTPWMNDMPELCVLIGEQADDASDILHTPLDAYVVLIPEGN